MRTFLGNMIGSRNIFYYSSVVECGERWVIPHINSSKSYVISCESLVENRRRRR